MSSNNIPEEELKNRYFWNDNNPHNKKCVICGVNIGLSGDTCTKSHASTLSHLTRGWLQQVECSGCGKLFPVQFRMRNRAKACGKECNKLHRAKEMKGEGNHQFGLRNSLNASFKGGKFVDSHGYIRVLNHDHPNSDALGYVKEHILVMSNLLGRPIDSKLECVHHKNGDKTDNSPDNLQLLTKSEHTSMHNSLREQPRDIESGRFLSKQIGGSKDGK